MDGDVLFYVFAILAVLIVGISKGGFGGGMGTLAVPVMALVISPVKAAAIMLPILCAMDIVLVWVYRKSWHRPNIAVLLPGAVTGIAIGGLSFHYMNDDVIRLIVGSIAILFALNWFMTFRRKQAAAGKSLSKPSGLFFGMISGFTSFVAHAGGAPVNMHLFPQKLDKTVYQATTAVFFLAVNYTKLIPYSLLGLFQGDNLGTSLLLLPVAPVGIWLGIWLHHRVSDVVFYRICYVALFLTGIKLVWDGLG